MTFNKSLVWDAAPLCGLRPTACRYVPKSEQTSQ
jgi:hypothetical protein